MRDPILLDLPDQFETERLIVRSPRWGDGLGLFEAVAESRDALTPWLPWARFDHRTIDDSELWVRRAQANFLLRKPLHFLFFLKESETLIGGIGLHPQDWDVPSFEIGYWQRTAYTGHGSMTEAVKGLTEYARERLHTCRLIIRCDTLNARSRAVAERAGYALEATQRSEGRSEGGELRDVFVFAKTWSSASSAP